MLVLIAEGDYRTSPYPARPSPTATSTATASTAEAPAPAARAKAAAPAGALGARCRAALESGEPPGPRSTALRRGAAALAGRCPGIRRTTGRSCTAIGLGLAGSPLPLGLAPGRVLALLRLTTCRVFTLLRLTTGGVFALLRLAIR